jgi:two-component system phosphate regulon sensor histidine kinase PhoR
MHINVYMLALLNRKREEMVDQPISEVLEHEDLLSFLVQQGIEGQGQPLNHAEITFPAVAPGNLFQVSTSNLRDGEEAVVGRMILVDDITNEKLAEKAKQEFVAHVTHELYTPLTTIKSYNEMLMAGEVRDGETQREFYNTIMEETDRLQRLIENLLNISKIEMGSLTLDRGLVKSDWLVHDCIAAVEGAARKKQITIEKVLPDNYPSLLGDKELLKVAIINILGNAVKYTPEHGKITFSLSEENNTAVFQISDSGYGISAEDLPHIFDKFYRSQDPNVTAKTGSGLGLGITSEIIHLHGGKIEVESQPGEGTHFSVKVPREEYYVGS